MKNGEVIGLSFFGLEVSDGKYVRLYSDDISRRGCTNRYEPAWAGRLVSEVRFRTTDNPCQVVQ
jgi:hypothetical protein